MLRDLSRRTFIRTATGLISAHWGGLHILAGPPSALAQASPAAQSGPVPQEFIYGTEFFRPPNPPRALRHEMLQAIANEYKFNIIRIYCSWVYLNPEPGKFDFAEIEEVLTDCDRLGLKVLMGAVIEEAPYWLEAAHPESRFVDALGEPQRLQTASINMSGGWPSLCMDWLPVRDAAATFLRQLAKVVSPHPSMYAYDVWMRPRDIRLWNWMLVAMGGKGIIYWCYLTEATGTESTGFGLVERDGSASERVLEAAEDHKLIQAQWEIIKDYQPSPEVAVLVDIDNALLTFAMSGKEDASTKSFAGYYKALWNSDVLVDFIEPQSLRDSQKYKVIIAPWHLIGKEETCDRLRQFVEGGGTLLLETGFASYDEHMVYNPIVPPFGLAEAFGYREQESLYMTPSDVRDNPKPEDLPPSERVYIEGQLTFTEPVAVTVKAHTFLTPITVSSAKVIAAYESTPVAATKKLGKGQVYYIGTNLGASIEEGSQAGIELVRAIVGQAVQPVVTAKKVRPRLIESRAGSLLIVFNDQITDQTVRVQVPSRYKTAMNIYGNQSQNIQGGAVDIQVPFEGANVLLLS